MSEFVENVVITLEHYENMKRNINDLENENEELKNRLTQNKRTLDKFLKPLAIAKLSQDQYNEFIEHLDNGNFEALAMPLNSPENPMTIEIGYTIKIKREVR